MPAYSEEELAEIQRLERPRIYDAEPFDWKLPSATITHVFVLEQRIAKLVLSDGRILALYHDQDCCEDVYIADGADELQTLVGEVLTGIEVVSKPFSQEELNEHGEESATWTFMNVITNKDSVQLRWYGSSNGYYSESADYADITRSVRNALCQQYADKIQAGPFLVDVAILKWNTETQTFQIVTSDGNIIAYGVKTELPAILDKFKKLKGAVHEIFG